MEKETNPQGLPAHELVAVDSISTRLDNHRQEMNKVKMKELMESIERDGLLHEVKVCQRGEELLLVYGFRRLAAFKELKRDRIPATVVVGLTDEQIREERAIENLQREDLSPIDEALLIKELMVNGQKMEIVAARLGKGPTWARERLDLLRLDPRIHPFVASGRLPLKHAFLMARVGDKKKQLDLLDSAIGTDDGKDDPQNFRGADYVEPIGSLRSMISGGFEKLGSAHWPKDKSYAGRIACVGCPDNTNSEPTLFESLNLRITSTKGNCTNRECFYHKMHAWEKDPEKKRRDKERERQKAEEAKKALEAAEENPEDGKQGGESVAARQARVKALQKKFPWTAEQKLTLALYQYGMDVHEAVGEKLIKSPPKNALEVLLVLSKELDREITWWHIDTKKFPTLDQVLKGTPLKGVELARIWYHIAPSTEEYDKPEITERGEVRGVPLSDHARDGLKILAKIAKAWNINVPQPDAKDFEDDPPAEDKTAGTGISGKPKASDLEKIRSARNAKVQKTGDSKKNERKGK